MGDCITSLLQNFTGRPSWPSPDFRAMLSAVLKPFEFFRVVMGNKTVDEFVKVALEGLL